MSYHPVVQQIIDLLEEHQVWFETFEHQPVTTSEEAAAIRDGYNLHQGTKAMIVKLKYAADEEKFAMLAFPADLRFDRQKVKAFFSAQRVSLASQAEVKKITKGVEIGGVPPFGQFFSLPVIADPSLLENEKIIFSAGDRSKSIGMKAKDYLSIVKPELALIV